MIAIAIAFIAGFIVGLVFVPLWTWSIEILFPPVGENETDQEFIYRICTQAIWVMTAALVIVLLVIIALCL